MAFEQINSQKKYTKYKRHSNNVGESLDAANLNQLQDDVVETQQVVNEVQDTAFEERVYTIFENNLFTNAMFMDPLDHLEYVRSVTMENISFYKDRSYLTLWNKSKQGSFLTTKILSTKGANVPINDFFLIANEIKPAGTKIEYTLVLDNGERFKITPNETNKPLHLSENLINGCSLFITMIPNGLGESPCLSGYALLYWDEEVEQNLGLVNPDLKRFPRSRNRLG